MTSELLPSDVVTPDAPAEAAQPRRRGHRGRNLVLVALLLAVLAVIGGSAAVAAWDKSYDGRILPGVRAGSVDLSGKTREEAAAALAAAYAFDQGSVVLRTPAGDLSIPYAGFGRRLDADTMITEALAAGRTGDFPARVPTEVRQALGGTDVEVRLLVDQDALAAAVSSALAPLAMAPVDATVTMGSAGPTTTAAQAGRTFDAAPAIAEAADAVARIDAPAEITIAVGVTSLEPTVTDDEVAAAIAQAGRMVGDVTVTHKKQQWTIRAGAVRSWITFAAADGTVSAVVDQARVPASLKKVAKKVAVKPQSAVFLHTKTGHIFGVAPGKDGKQLDTATTSARLAAELEGRANGTPAAPVKLALAPVTPDLTTEEAQQSASLMTKLGTWTTWFPISDHNFFGANIWVPAKLINGMVLRPGATFDWFTAVGPVNTARGFGPGGVIRGSYTDPTGALGGGMCSSSTTLFNAALRAGLQMGARDNHKYYIPRYPLGLDATVWIMGGVTQSMTFTNDTSHPILIRGIKTRSGSTGYVTYELWGVADGRTTTIGRPIVTNVVRATTRTEYVTTLPAGQRLQVEYPSNQMDVAVSRVVKDANGHVIHAEVWRTHYILWNGLIQVGQ